MISPHHDIAGMYRSSSNKLEFQYVSERYTMQNVCNAKYAFKSCTLAKLWAEMVQVPMTNSNVFVQITFSAQYLHLKINFVKKRNKKCENKNTKKHSFNLCKS